MSETWPTFQNRQAAQFMDVLTTRSFTQKLSSSTQLISMEEITQRRVAIRQLRPSDLSSVIRQMTALFRSQPLQSMVTSGLTISATGSSTPSSLTTAPRPQLRGEERDPRLRGRHQPGEDGRPQGPGERERGDATILPRQLSLLVHIVAYLRSIIVFDITISSIHISKPSTCRSFTTVYRDAYVRDVTRAASVSERAFRRMKMYN